MLARFALALLHRSSLSVVSDYPLSSSSSSLVSYYHPFSSSPDNVRCFLSLQRAETFDFLLPPYLPVTTSRTREFGSLRTLSSTSTSRVDKLTFIEEQILENQAKIKAVDQRISKVEDEIEKATTDDEREKLQAKMSNLLTLYSSLARIQVQLRDEKAALPQPTQQAGSSQPAATTIPLDDLNQAVEFLRQNDLLRSPDDRLTKPFVLVSESAQELMDRQQAWDGFFEYTKLRHKAVVIDRTFGQIVTAFGGPGSGKSRFLDELASPEGRKKALSNMSKLEPKFREAIHDAVGVSITFNGKTPHRALCHADAIPTSALALRIFFSYFVANCTWGEFCQRVSASTLDLQRVLEVVLNDIDEISPYTQRLLLLCIDEIKMGVTHRLPQGSSERDLILDLIRNIGSSLDEYRRVHIVISSLFYKILADNSTNSGRGVQRLPLYPLSITSTLKLYGSTLENRSKRDRNIAMQLFQDAGGSPRLLYETNEIIQANPGESLDSMRTKLAGIPVFREIERNYGTAVLLDAVIAALRGENARLSANEPGIVMGLLMMQAAPNITRYTPTIAASTFYCLNALDPQTKAENPTASELIHLTRMFLEETKDDREYTGGAFERQFRLLWQIRCLAYVAQTQSEYLITTEGQIPKPLNPKDQDPETMERSLSLKMLLGTTFPVSIGSVFTGKTNDIIVVPGKMKMKESKKPQVTVNTFWTPTRPTFEGIDGLATYQRPEGRPLVLGFQYKYSALNLKNNDNTITPLTCEDVAEAIVLTYKHHKALRPYINTGDFVFIFARHRRLQKPLSTRPLSSSSSSSSSSNSSVEAKTEDERYFSHLYNEELNKQFDKLIAKWKEGTEEEKEAFFKAQKNIAILDIQTMRRILTPTLTRNAPFSKPTEEEEDN